MKRHLASVLDQADRQTGQVRVVSNAPRASKPTILGDLLAALLAAVALVFWDLGKAVMAWVNPKRLTRPVFDRLKVALGLTKTEAPSMELYRRRDQERRAAPPATAEVDIRDPEPSGALKYQALFGDY